MTDYRNQIKDYLRIEKEVIEKLDIDAVNDAINALVDTQENGNTVFVFGNGGSAAAASHMQNDFNKGLSEYLDKKFSFQCLNDNVATLMAIANDISYEDVFSFQLKGHLKPGDVVVAISGSGNSKNVIKAVEYARSCGNKIIGLTGFEGGKLKQLSDISLHAPINSMQVTEDIHMIYNHLMMSVLYGSLCGINHLR